jgi:zinc protease
MEKDDKPTKQTARRMMLMMIDINKNFGDKTMVNCATCHRGQTKPAAIPPLPSVGSPILATKSAAVQAALPTVDEILNRYVQTLGGSRAIEKINTRTRKGSVQIGASNGTFEHYEAAPNKSLLKGTLPPPLGSVHQVFDGQKGWVKNQGGVFEMSGDGLVQAQRESIFLTDFKLKEQYKSMSVAGRERVGHREFYVVEGTRENGQIEKLWFDVATGLLARKYSETTTYFGQLPSAVDYDDYRKVRNVLFPFAVRRVRAGNTFLQIISELKVNTPLDDSIFRKPVNTNKP